MITNSPTIHQYTQHTQISSIQNVLDKRKFQQHQEFPSVSDGIKTKTITKQVCHIQSSDTGSGLYVNPEHPVSSIQTGQTVLNVFSFWSSEKSKQSDGIFTWSIKQLTITKTSELDQVHQALVSVDVGLKSKIDSEIASTTISNNKRKVCLNS